MNVHITAEISESSEIAESAKIWHYAQIREGAIVSDDCIIGRGVYIGPGVKLGPRCKVQNYALVYEPARLEEGVFIGPAAVLTNDQYPRAINVDRSKKTNEDWNAVGVVVKKGASIGANATVIAPAIVGEWALVGSGAVVTRNVPNFALVVGNPARRIRWVGKAGVPLEETNTPGRFICPETGDFYSEISANELIETE